MPNCYCYSLYHVLPVLVYYAPESFTREFSSLASFAVCVTTAHVRYELTPFVHANCRLELSTVQAIVSVFVSWQSTLSLEPNSNSLRFHVVLQYGRYGTVDYQSSQQSKQLVQSSTVRVDQLDQLEATGKFSVPDLIWIQNCTSVLDQSFSCRFLDTVPVLQYLTYSMQE